MRKLLIAALIAGQVMGAATPAFAQSFSPVRETEAGTFGGVRVRIPFGTAGREPVRAGFAFAPIARTDYQDGRVRTRMGEGLEFGLRGREPMQFTIGGRTFRQHLAAREGAEGERRGGMSTGMWIAGGLVLVTVGVVVAAALALEDADDD